MRIRSIKIKNFKGIECQEFRFPRRFSVVIGDNATGKTSILDAMAVALGSFFLGIDGVNTRGIQPSEIRVIDIDGQPRPQLPVVIEAFGEIDHQEVGPWRREIVTKNTTHGGAQAIKKIAQAKLKTSRNPQTDPSDKTIFPLIVYHGTGRLWAEHEKVSYQPQIEGVVRAYTNALSIKSSSKEFLSWFKTQEDSIKKFNRPLEIEHFGAFKTAVFEMLPTKRWKSIEWDYKADELVAGFLDAKDEVHHLTFSQLSDGYRNLIGMVADIAFRCLQLNPHLGGNAVVDTPGVVLIDELDLHLHPNWQRTVVRDLKRVFPKIQFIATTHSPFIVQSLGENELINLDSELPEPVPDTLPLSTVATELMGVEHIRSDNFESRVTSAIQSLQDIRAEKGELTLDDYVRISEVANKLQLSDTDDPEYKAYLLETAKDGRE